MHKFLPGLCLVVLTIIYFTQLSPEKGPEHWLGIPVLVWFLYSVISGGICFRRKQWVPGVFNFLVFPLISVLLIGWGLSRKESPGVSAPMGDLPFSCSQSEDCVIVYDQCQRPIGVNKEHRNSYLEFILSQKNAKCESGQSAPPVVSPPVQCLQGECQIQK